MLSVSLSVFLYQSQAAASLFLIFQYKMIQVDYNFGDSPDEIFFSRHHYTSRKTLNEEESCYKKAICTKD